MNNDVVICRGDFDSDAELAEWIESLFGMVERDSKRAWEEYCEVKGFGLTMKPEGGPIANLNDLQQGLMLRCQAKTFALACEGEDDLPLVRAVLYGAVCGLLNGKPKKNLHMFWRMRPVTASDADFETTIVKHRVVFRLGAWYAPNEPLLLDAVAL